MNDGTVRVQKGWLADLEAEVARLRAIEQAAREVVVVWSLPDATDAQNETVARRARALNDALAAAPVEPLPEQEPSE